MIDVDDESASMTCRRGFYHEVEGEFASEFDESVVSSFGDDENVLDG